MAKPNMKLLNQKINEFTTTLNTSLSPEQLDQWMIFLREKKMRDGFNRALERRNLKQAAKHWDDTQYISYDDAPQSLTYSDLTKGIL